MLKNDIDVVKEFLLDKDGLLEDIKNGKHTISSAYHEQERRKEFMKELSTVEPATLEAETLHYLAELIGEYKKLQVRLSIENNKNEEPSSVRSPFYYSLKTTKEIAV